MKLDLEPKPKVIIFNYSKIPRHLQEQAMKSTNIEIVFTNIGSGLFWTTLLLLPHLRKCPVYLNHQRLPFGIVVPSITATTWLWMLLCIWEPSDQSPWPEVPFKYWTHSSHSVWLDAPLLWFCTHSWGSGLSQCSFLIPCALSKVIHLEGI